MVLDAQGDRAATVNRTPESQQLMVEILDAAAALFSRGGFQGTTTQQLADAVGLVKATLYYHIGNKEELLFRITKTVIDERIERWEPIVANRATPTPEVIRALIEEHCKMIPQFREWFLVVADELKHLPPHLLPQVLERIDYTNAMLQEVIERGVANGELAANDAHAAALVVMAMLNSMNRWYRPRGRLSNDQLARETTAVVLNGVLA
jgi:AcrR family transcriptional regulator